MLRFGWVRSPGKALMTPVSLKHLLGASLGEHPTHAPTWHQKLQQQEPESTRVDPALCAGGPGGDSKIWCWVSWWGLQESPTWGWGLRGESGAKSRLRWGGAAHGKEVFWLEHHIWGP